MADVRVVQFKLDAADYPQELLQLPNPPPILTTSGPLEKRRAIAIVGSRDACDEALVFAHDLAFQLATAGVLVISGGAIGVDGAAHRGALAAGGPTWVVSPTGKDRLYPKEHEGLFEEIAASTHSRMLWPFADDTGGGPQADGRLMRYRNGVLAVLSEALVVVQAHYKSGSRNAAAWARELRRPVWAVAAAPWMAAFCGSLTEIAQGTARPLCSATQFFDVLRLGKPATAPPVDPRSFHAKGPRQNNRRAFEARAILQGPPKPLDMGSWSQEEKVVFSILSMDPMHTDQIIDRIGLPVPPVVTALLTLTFKDVVVEGPRGFFCRKTAG